jgi:DNA-directed RNA polymerase subunit E'
MDDFVSYDSKNSIFHGRESKRLLKEGDIVVSRVVSVSMDANQFKIGLTTRQPGLGALSWIEKEKKGIREPRKERPREGKRGKKRRKE